VPARTRRPHSTTRSAPADWRSRSRRIWSGWTARTAGAKPRGTRWNRSGTARGSRPPTRFWWGWIPA